MAQPTSPKFRGSWVPNTVDVVEPRNFFPESATKKDKKGATEPASTRKGMQPIIDERRKRYQEKSKLRQQRFAALQQKLPGRNSKTRVLLFKCSAESSKQTQNIEEEKADDGDQRIVTPAKERSKPHQQSSHVASVPQLDTKLKPFTIDPECLSGVSRAVNQVSNVRESQASTLNTPVGDGKLVPASRGELKNNDGVDGELSRTGTSQTLHIFSIKPRSFPTREDECDERVNVGTLNLQSHANHVPSVVSEIEKSETGRSPKLHPFSISIRNFPTQYSGEECHDDEQCKTYASANLKEEEESIESQPAPEQGGLKLRQFTIDVKNFPTHEGDDSIRTEADDSIHAERDGSLHAEEYAEIIETQPASDENGSKIHQFTIDVKNFPTREGDDAVPEAQTGGDSEQVEIERPELDSNSTSNVSSDPELKLKPFSLIAVNSFPKHELDDETALAASLKNEAIPSSSAVENHQSSLGQSYDGVRLEPFSLLSLKSFPDHDGVTNESSDTSSNETNAVVGDTSQEVENQTILSSSGTTDGLRLHPFSLTTLKTFPTREDDDCSTSTLEENTNESTSPVDAGDSDNGAQPVESMYKLEPFSIAVDNFPTQNNS